MSRRSWPALAALACAAGLAWVPAGFPARAPAADDKPAASADVFGLTNVHEFHLDFSAREWERMQAVTGGMPFPGAPGAPGGPAKPAEKPGEEPIERHKSPGFGIEFPWAHGDFSAGGKTYKNVGVRYKGNGSYVPSTGGLKRNLKVELDRYDAGQRHQGLKTVNLNAGATDPTKAREALAYAVFRAAGVPAPRTAFAQVTLTVPGKYDKEYLGLYTVVEQVDRTFLKEHFKNAKGVLMKPERVRGLEYLGDDWDKYKDRYQPKHEPSKDEARRVIEFVKLVNRADDEQFKKEIDKYLDVDEFLRFVAGTALVANLDSFFTIGHNYYLYLNPETSKFAFIPWDLDLAFGSFFMFGPPDQQADLSLTHPYPGENKLVDRLLALKDVSDKYQKLLKELSTTCFTKDAVLKDVDALEKVIREPLAREKKAVQARKEGAGGFGPPGGMFGQPFDLRGFVEKRTASVAAQVAGKSKGYVPAMGFGPGGPGGPPGGFGRGGFGGPPQPGQVLAPPLPDVLRLTAEQKKQLNELQKDVDGRLAKILTDEQKKQLKDMQQGFGRGGFGPGGPPGGFGPGNFWAKPLLEALDADKDGKVSRDELVAGAKKFFGDCDKDKKGKIDEKQIAEGLNRIFPQPQGFGPPGGPGGFGPGNFLAGAVVKRAEADKDGKVTLDKLVAAAEALFKEADKDKKGKLDEQAVAAGINLLFPPPPAFGPPGGPP